MRYTMNSDIMHTNHRRLEMAFKSAAKARNQGAQEVTVEWNGLEPRTDGGRRGVQYFQDAFQKTSDGIYARVQGITETNEIMRIHNFALQHGLPFSPTASWSRTDGTPVTADV